MRVAAGKTNDSDTWLRNDRWSNRCISPGREDTVAAISSYCGTGCARCCVQQGDGDSTDPNRDSALSVLPFSERGRSERSHNHGCRLLQSLNHADSRRAVYRPNSKSDLTFQQNFDLDTAAETHTHTHKRVAQDSNQNTRMSSSPWPAMLARLPNTPGRTCSVSDQSARQRY